MAHSASTLPPSGPSEKLSSSVYSQTLNEIMPMIYRRFTEKSAEEWRQIYKALQLLEFLIKNGSERVIDDARGHITLLKMLRQFHYIDQNGKDQGVNVRNRAKELAELLSDVDRIRSERKKARATKNKYTGAEGGASFGSGFSGGDRYGGFGSESISGYGGYSGGVYGDGGGFGGQSNDWQEDGSRSERFEEYDEFDEDERPSKTSKRSERAGEKKTTKKLPEAKKEPEVDLFSFDEPAQSSSAASTTAMPEVVGSSTINTNADDDDFDDFQSATPGAPEGNGSESFAPPLSPPLTASATTTAQLAAPQPVSAPQKAGLSQMVNLSSLSRPASNSGTPVPISAGLNTAAVSSPQSAKPTGYQPSGPNYFSSVQTVQGSAPGAVTPGMGGVGGMPSVASHTPTTMANAKPVTNPRTNLAAGASGGDAFGALWGKASAGIKKTQTPSSGPAMGQLAKEKSSAGIWGAPTTASQAPASHAPANNASGSVSDDLLG